MDYKEKVKTLKRMLNEEATRENANKLLDLFNLDARRGDFYYFTNRGAEDFRLYIIPRLYVVAVMGLGEGHEVLSLSNEWGSRLAIMAGQEWLYN